MSAFFISQVAQSVPYNPDLLEYDKTNVQEALDEFVKTVVTLQQAQAVVDGTTVHYVSYDPLLNLALEPIKKVEV